MGTKKYFFPYQKRDAIKYIIYQAQNISLTHVIFLNNFILWNLLICYFYFLNDLLEFLITRVLYKWCKSVL